MGEDFRDILKNKLSERCGKNQSYSLRAFARDLEISPQRLSHVLSGRHGLSLAAAESIALNLGMNEKEKVYFCALVQKKHARSKTLKTEAEKKLKKIKNTYQQLNLDHFKIIADWYHFAIMELSLVEGFSSEPSWIARSLGISEIETKMAIERLLKLKMLERDKKKQLKLTGQFFSDPCGIPSDAIKKFHRQLIQKSATALEEQSLQHREFSSTVLAMNEEDLPEAKKVLKEFRESFDKRFSASQKKTKVYALGIQLFGLQNKIEKEGK